MYSHVVGTGIAHALPFIRSVAAHFCSDTSFSTLDTLLSILASILHVCVVGVHTVLETCPCLTPACVV